MIAAGAALMMAMAVLPAAPGMPMRGAEARRVLRGNAVEDFSTVLREAGFRVKSGITPEGDRYLESSADGVYFTVTFSDCEPAQGCAGLRFLAWWNKPSYADAGTVNEWNRRYKLARAAIDEQGDIVLDYYLSLVGGVSRENFLDSYDWWMLLMRDFRSFLDEKEQSARSVRGAMEELGGVAAVDEQISG